MAYTKLTPHHTTGASVEEIPSESGRRAYRLIIPAGPAGKYRLAQLDDYTKLSRGRFPLRAPTSLSLFARVSDESIPGTWGFGFWNDPFGLSLGFGGNPFRLPSLPNALWFFGASKESYLSFKRDPRPERSEVQTKGPLQGALRLRATPSAQRGVAANGFLAQTFRSPRFDPRLILAGLALPFSRKATRRWMGRVIGEDGIRLNVDVAQWHRYSLKWREERVTFEVDEAQVFESPISPHPPLGLVIWIDNQFAAFTPEGRIGFGVLENPEPAWLEIKDLEVT